MLIIYGCGGHARSVADVALAYGIKVLLFIDENARPNEKIFNFSVYKDIPALDSKEINAIIAIGDNKSRAQLFEKNIPYLSSLIAKNAHIGINVVIDLGVFVASNAHIGPNSKIHANTIINTACVIEHDCVIGKHSHISVNATIAGKCTIGDFVMIGASTTVIDGINICSHVVVGAGSVVIKDITEPGTYVGVPAKKIK